MGFAAAAPGLLLITAACVVLALVSFNTPLLKNFYFLAATFDSGDYDGTLKLGTLGYCLESGGKSTCTGPVIGYNFDLNKILNFSLVKIPTAVSKYLTYALILHIVALGFGVVALIFGILDAIPGFFLMCFPTCFAGIAATLSLIAFIFDVAIFYIAKSRIDSASGASATIGAAVWMTLAAWLLFSFAGCAYGMSRCCCCGNQSDERDRRRRERERKAERKAENDDMRMDAIRDERRRQKEQGLPNFQELERQPLTRANEDKYLYEENDVVPALARNGSVIQGVGVGYGRRNNQQQTQYDQNYYDPYAATSLAPGAGVRRQPSTLSAFTNPGAAGVGSGGAGLDLPRRYNNEYENQASEQMADNYDGNYNGQQTAYYNDYGSSQSHGQQETYYNNPNYGNAAYAPPVPPPAAAHDYYPSNDQFPQPHTDQYGAQAQSRGYGYEDDGLGAIGRAVTSPTGERQYTGAQGFNSAPAVHAPAPQHLAQAQNSNLLTSPTSEYPDYSNGARSPASAYTYNTEHESTEPRPPSYGTVTTPVVVRPEKSGF